MKRKTYILASLILTALVGAAALWNFSARTASAQKADADENLSVGAVTEYDARDEFSNTQNPNGVWSYGYSTSDADNTLNLFTFPNDSANGAGCGGVFEQWRINNGDQIPQITRHNPAATCLNIPANALFMHPGYNNQRAVTRWTAPTGGTFQITGTFQKQNPSATTDLKIIKNAAAPGETTLYTATIGAVSQQAFNFTVTVAAGETLDFSVGDDGNNAWQSDGSSISVNIGPPVTACQTAPANLQVFVPGENSPSDVRSVNPNASLAGDATYTNNGKIGRAFEFDGVGDYVRVEDNAAQRPATALTVEGWFKFDTASGIVSLVSKPIRNSALNSYTLYLDGGQLRGLVGNASQFTRAFSGFTPQTGVWHHLAFTYDFTGGVSTLKLYANGTEVTSGQDGTPNLPLSYEANPFPLLIGGEYETNAPGFWLDGQADEISIYGRALSGNEIFDLVRQGSFGKCAPGAACTTAPQGLVSWYKGEDNALDSNSLNPGALAGGTTFQSGQVGRGFKFDGVDDRVEIPDSPSLKPQNLTVETWVKFDSLSSNTSGGAINGTQYLVFKKNQAGGNFEGFVLNKNPNNTLRFGFGQGNGSPGAVVDSTTLATTGVFYHVVGTYDGSTAKIYVNGQLEATVPYNLPLNYDTRPLFLGTSGEAAFDGKFNGVLDEVSIYNRAITAAEVSTLFNAGANGKCLAYVCAETPNDLVSWFAGERNALDSRSNNHGALQNGATFAPGRVGQAFNLPTVNDFVSVPDAPSLRPTNLTLEGWFNFSTAPSGIQVLASKNAAVGNSFVIYYDNGFLRGQTGDGSGTFGNPVSVAFAPTAGQWYYIAYSWQSGGNEVLYVNGAAVDANAADVAPGYTNNPFTIGAGGGFSFQGRADEVSLYSRALSAAEISSVYNADSPGKCKPTGLNPAANLVGFWTGDGDARDFAGEDQNGTFAANSYAVGKVGQAFSFNGTSNVEAANAPQLNPSQLTLETWVYKTAGGDADIAGKDGETFDRQYWLGAASNSRFRPHITTSGSGLVFFDGATAYNLNEWYHVAMTYDGATLRLYVNGVLDGSVAASGSIIATSQPFRIGGGAPGANLPQFFTGRIDETSLYDRALSASEIAAVYNAGVAGKLKEKTVPFAPPLGTAKSKRTVYAGGALVPATVQLSDATVTFANVTSSGTVSQNGIDLGFLPRLPPSVTFTGLAYDIRTTVNYQQGSADDVRVCFNAPALSALNFSRLIVLHLENGAWVNRTAAGNTSPNLCTDNLTSLSPFVIVQSLAPTAASVSVSGRIADASGAGLSGVTVALTDSQGRSVYARSNNFGRYSFNTVAVGEIYTVSVSSKRYSFSISSQAVNVQDAVENVDFTADAEAFEAKDEQETPLIKRR